MLYVPAALLDYKFSLLHEKGELVNSMYIRKADFLKEELHAYDNDIGYGDIWISVFYFLTEKVLNIPDGFPSPVRWIGNHFLFGYLYLQNYISMRIIIKAATHRWSGKALTNILIEIAT